MKGEGKKRKNAGRARTRGKVRGGRRANALCVCRGVEVCRPLRVRGNMEVRGKPPWDRHCRHGLLWRGQLVAEGHKEREGAQKGRWGLWWTSADVRYVDEKTAPLREGEAPSVVWNQPLD